MQANSILLYPLARLHYIRNSVHLHVRNIGHLFPSITTIKKRVRIYKQFEFSNIDLFNTISKIQALDSSKASSGSIPTAIIRDAKEVICPYLTSCINAVINNCYFPDKLKEADGTAIHNNGDKCHKKITGLLVFYQTFPR